MTRRTWTYLFLALLLGVLGLGLWSSPFPPSPPGPGEVGAGPAFRNPFGLEPGLSGTLLVLDSSQGLVLEVDPRTGDRRAVCGGAEEAREGLTAPTGIVALPDGSYFVADSNRRLIYRKWSRSGQRKIVSGRGHVGRGPAFQDLGRMARLPDGSLVVIDRGIRGLVRVDPSTGDRTVLAGAGPELYEPDDLLVLADGRVLVADNFLGRIVEVDPESGARRVALDVRRVPGPKLYRPYGLGPGPAGTVLVAHPNLARVLAWNPATGAHDLLTTPEEGEGAMMTSVEDVIALSDGSIACCDARQGALVRVAPGEPRRVLSGRPMPSGRVQAVAYAAALHSEGYGLAVDGLGGRLLRFDPAAGLFEVVSGAGRGRGPALAAPNEVAPGPGGTALVVDWIEGLLEVDLRSGDRRVLVGPDGTEEVPLLTPYDVQASPEGRVFLLDARGGRLAEVDRSSGTLRLLAGSGIPWEEPLRMAWTRTGRLLVTDSGTASLVQVDPASGERTVLSGPGVGSGPLPRLLEALGERGDGSLVVSDGDLGSLLAVAPSGERSLLSGRQRGAGPGLDAPEDIMECPDGSLLVCDPGLPGLLRVDPRTGDRTLLPLRPR